MMRKLSLTGVIVIIMQLPVFSQVIPDNLFQDDTVFYEKLYLHIDRELYSPGDDIWFKSYLVDGKNNQLIPGFRNIYVELVAEDGRIIDQRLMLSFNGVSNNDFFLPDTLSKGQYIIRGYTRYLQNFGEESLFHQKIVVSEATDLPEFEDKPEEQTMIDVSFLPEGGNLVMNTANFIAFKAINDKGKGIPVTGQIVDETGETVTQFTTKYKGMGMFLLMPKEGKKYYAWVDDYPNFTYRFEDARTGGIALHYKREGDNLLFVLSQDIKSQEIRNLVLAVSHGGEELFREEFKIKGFQYPVYINKDLIPPGISKITVFDSQNNILAERLVFMRYLDDNTFRITPDKPKYKPREKATLKIESLLNPEEDRIEAGLSVAVVNEDYFSGDNRNQTIESYLLLDSELKGPVESPALCFIDEENITAHEKLDLVMLVNGWRRYFPDELEDYFRNPLSGREDVGLTLKGDVKTLWGERPVKGGEVELGPFSGLFLILNDTTDELGKFSFNRLFLKDSAQVMVNAKNAKGRNNNVEVFCESIPVFDSKIPIDKTLELNRTIRKIEIPDKFRRSEFYRYQAESEFKLEEGSILIKEVEVKAELKSPPNIIGVYGFPTRSYILTDTDRKNYPDVLKYIEFEIPGVIDYGDGIRIGTAKNRPLIFVNGLPPFRLTDIEMNDIAKIEIIPPVMKHFQEVYINGAKGGVISILTKSGFGFGKINYKSERIIHGRIIPRVRGFQQAHEFYSPKYSLVKQDSIEKPDQRPTLFWNPNVMLENGEANLEFFTSDMAGRYQIVVEGISANGKVCYGKSSLNVKTP